jgi:secondary thiamine-phosphate synthase enzyme
VLTQVPLAPHRSQATREVTQAPPVSQLSQPVSQVVPTPPSATAVLPESAAPATYVLPMRCLTRVVPVRTERHLEFVDITDEVAQVVAEAGVREGFAVVFSRHTTAGIRINEHEPLLLEDMARLLEVTVPTGNYRHDDLTVRTVNLEDETRVNGHSHCRSLLLGASETVPVSAGCLLLGRWQRVFLVELDGPARREFVVQVVGGA